MKTQKQKDYNKISQRLYRIWKNLVDWISNIDGFVKAVGFEILLYFLDTLVDFMVVLMFALLFKACKESNKIEEEQTKTITEKKSPEIKWKIDTVFVLPPINNGYVVTFKAKDNYTLKIEPYKVSGLIQNP